MDSKELLVSAASAAGIELLDVVMMGRGLLLKAGGVWNPLDDDGDALRLANKLQLNVQIGRLDGAVVVTSNNDNRIYSSESWLPGETSDKATRLSIVRAAVEIRNGIAPALLGCVPEDNYYETHPEAEADYRPAVSDTKGSGK